MIVSFSCPTLSLQPRTSLPSGEPLSTYNTPLALLHLQRSQIIFFISVFSAFPWQTEVVVEEEAEVVDLAEEEVISVVEEEGTKEEVEVMVAVVAVVAVVDIVEDLEVVEVFEVEEAGVEAGVPWAL